MKLFKARNSSVTFLLRFGDSISSFFRKEFSAIVLVLLFGHKKAQGLGLAR